MSLKSGYLVAYNAVSAALWAAVLARVVTLATQVGVRNVFDGADELVRLVQTGALLEVVHSAVGLVRAPLLTTAMQVASRLLLVWGISYNYPQSTRSSPAFAGMLIAWSVTEVIRYSYFVFALRGRVPGPLAWLRYNTFFILYPLGISCECWLVFRAIEPAQKQNPLIAYALWAILAVYVPGSYVLFTHMMAQRRRIMRGKKRAD
ncbi:uncharacterized protein K452DRAFT_328575 [Aplosporella prunicola CBS 121167]|uniref:Very-long-chain (3R)-3-hydroxyacyl-CoA dehydratase n=1 Tax=Aplosporella prunicola CBS 121167 TaxID=1176127 RepID=A0A6A6B596_9PEZI|nr:uncharacterized protein K452DRAFT_328575 [Aplosporella prunicola CBS 121167]KAF2138798.1 hypothetical protein K452DRAFT_328575 [Aplosporella prunicola CBS 121167]